MTFQSEMEASLSTDTGMWDDYRFSGVCDVTIARDEASVRVQYCNGSEETIALDDTNSSQDCAAH
jgi:hypothetical protein